jgi:hypothetical protein
MGVSEEAGPRDLEATRIEDELQEDMARFSRRGKHIRVKSGHLIPLEKPEAVVNAVRAIVDERFSASFAR